MAAPGRNRRILPILAALAVTGLAPILAQGNQDSRLSYSYIRTIEGRATLASSGNGPGEEADLNQILQRGDRIRVERGARLELVLADRSIVRVGDGSDLALARIAFSEDGDDRTTRLDLDRGELVIEVTDDALGDELPEIDTLTAKVFIHEPGIYRVRAESDGYTELLVRTGYAELLTERGSTIVRAGEEAWTSGDRWRPVELVAAGARDTLERWSDELAETAVRAREQVPYVEPQLAYAAAPLADYGSWVSYDTSWYWQPRVASGWRPYYQGRWCWSPSGLTWVSSEPWGWVPYHYGTWCNLPGRGWAWRPGNVYSPAWVYWYWSDTWTGWCPTGYYTNFYRGYWNSGFRFGLYGWTGGQWGLYSDWNFSPTGRVCDRGFRGGWHHGDQVGHFGGPQEPNGILTTDTSGLPRDRWDRPAELVRVLERAPRDGRRRDLPVVTDFVAKKLDLPPLVDNAIRPEPGERTAQRRGTPLDPGGMSGGERGAGRHEPASEPQPGWRARQPVSNPRTVDRIDDRDRNQISPRIERAPRPPVGPGATGRGDAVGRNEDVSRNRFTPPSPSDRQGWRNGGTAGTPARTPTSDKTGDTVSSYRTHETPSPGAQWQRPAGGGDPTESGRVRGGSEDRADGTPARERFADGEARPATPPDRGDQGRANDDRKYGFPAREIGNGPQRLPLEPPPTGRSEGRGRYDFPGAPPAAPVERVIGGVRRAAPDSGAVRGGSAPGSAYGVPSAPRSGYGTAPSSGYRAPATPGARSGPSGYAPSQRQAPTTSHGAPPAGGASSGGRGPATQSGGQQASPSSSGSNSTSSSSSSSPPPRRAPRSSDHD